MGKQEGIQTRYFENGQVQRTENFKNRKCFDENVLMKMELK